MPEEPEMPEEEPALEPDREDVERAQKAAEEAKIRLPVKKKMPRPVVPKLCQRTPTDEELEGASELLFAEMADLLAEDNALYLPPGAKKGGKQKQPAPLEQFSQSELDT